MRRFALWQADEILQICSPKLQSAADFLLSNRSNKHRRVKVSRYEIINSFGRRVNKKILILILLTGILAPPVVASAAVDSIQSLSIAIASVMWVVFVGIAVVCFVLAGVFFLTALGDPEKIKRAKSALVWGVVGIIVAILAFSIIKITCGALGASC